MISVIIPVYNSENTIEKCIDSISVQSFGDIEIIIIDDGSTDDTGQICEKLAEKETRIRLVHKKNSGVSSARNLGIKLAVGEFIQFIDSDDYIEVNMCEKLYDTMIKNNSDLVICGYICHLKNSIYSNVLIDKSYESISDMSNDFSNLYTGVFLNPSWNKLYKRDLINFEFDKNLSLGEDLIFNINYINHCRKISTISYCLYNYVVGNVDSLAGKYRANLFDISLYLYRTILSNCKIWFKTEEYQYGLSRVLMDNVFGALQGEIFFGNKSNFDKLFFIKKCVNNQFVQQASNFINEGSTQKKIVFPLIRRKMVLLIYMFFSIKKITLNILNFLRI